MTELARWRCSRCNLTADVWLGRDGYPERMPICPNCHANGYPILMQPDEEATSLFDSGNDQPRAAST